MLTKAEKTTQFILEKVGPYFNKHGYTGTSLSAITEATGLTKGAIYGNFKDKEDLALQAFNYNIRRAMSILRERMSMEADGLTKLKEITRFFRKYYATEKLYGGCPMINVGIDSLNHNNTLYKRVVEVMNKLIQNIADIIEQAKQEGTIKPNIDSLKFANKIYAQIQGGIFITSMLKNESHLTELMNHIDHMIDTEMIK
ncbi:TetR/AcrR family transcriptional regulator [Reichenbachiella carrageenanivorans]|uniref:TetR/AcrR family transcriptional regulator n=1 Tax=Reichenbachiella carrageenanivorans TaxID=2979869 RepID=A0ABY6D1S7_9BACT|nr:TetR/AcrR family transcriptional regulator [Reichenbachiella carrageenanivorans]UXX79684.1 TetR/AcrR family transcriptional regulator [Reichenbachiella carrageenanivorans]